MRTFGAKIQADAGKMQSAAYEMADATGLSARDCHGILKQHLASVVDEELSRLSRRTLAKIAKVSG